MNIKFEAFVSDFEAARLLDPDSSNQTLVVGTYGYIALGELLFLDYMTIHIFFPFLAYYV